MAKIKVINTDVCETSEVLTFREHTAALAQLPGARPVSVNMSEVITNT